MEALQGQTVSHAERQDVFGIGGRGDDPLAGKPLHLLEFANLELQLLTQELLQAWQAEGVAQADHILNVRIPVRGGEISERALDLAEEIIEHRLERRKDLFEVGRLGGVAFEMFGFGERQLHILGQGPGEMVATERDVPLPDDALAVGDHQVRIVRADVQGDHAALLPLGGLVFVRLRLALFQQFVGDEIAQGQVGYLHDVDLDVDVLEMMQITSYHIPLNHYESDLRLHVKA